MYKLFMLSKEHFTPYALCKGVGLVTRERVTIANSGILSALYWNLVSRKKCYVYIVRNGNKVIHTSYVIHRCFKFPFLDKQDIEIGPCYTLAEERGKGIYPYVLSVILESHLEHGVAYMIVDEDNMSSLNGITKLGFSSVGQVRKDGLKRYVTT